MLKLILGRAGSGKTTKVLERICQNGQARPQVLMVPEQQSHEAERALCRMGGDGVSRYAEVLSFSRLANRVFQTAGGLGEEELDAGGWPEEQWRRAAEYLVGPPPEGAESPMLRMWLLQAL